MASTTASSPSALSGLSHFTTESLKIADPAATFSLTGPANSGSMSFAALALAAVMSSETCVEKVGAGRSVQTKQKRSFYLIDQDMQHKQSVTASKKGPLAKAALALCLLRELKYKKIHTGARPRRFQ